ncbi:MAG: hypothetical protein FVQ80_03235 [Planctomycetes bacterium]|nr:hypothetical protein [Planctomycetota bacterium]
MNRAKTENRTVEELKGALEHLEYEVWMLWSLANILAADDQGKSVIHNALLESFLIHTRILIEFLYKDEPYKDNVRASQYFTPDSSWESIRPPKTKLLNKTEGDTHKYLAHFTHTRSQKEKPRWSYIKIANDIKAVLQVFRENLPGDFTKESNV